MSAQTRYGYSSPIGSAGGIVDLAPYAIDTFLNEEDNGKVKFGMGVVTGTKKGINVKLPVKASAAANFEGVTVNRRTTESDMEGEVALRKAASIGVMRYGRIYVRVAKTVKPGYGDPVYLITEGDEAGCFTNAAASTDSGSADKATIAIKGRFLGGVDSSAQIAAVELFNEAQA